MAILTILIDGAEVEMDTHKNDRVINDVEVALRSRVLRHPKNFIVGTQGRLSDGRLYEVISVKSPLFVDKEELYRNPSLGETHDVREKVTILGRTELPDDGGYLYDYAYKGQRETKVPEAALLAFLTNK
jgi:hypothetical protein